MSTGQSTACLRHPAAPSRLHRCGQLKSLDPLQQVRPCGSASAPWLHTASSGIIVAGTKRFGSGSREASRDPWTLERASSPESASPARHTRSRRPGPSCPPFDQVAVQRDSRDTLDHTSPYELAVPTEGVKILLQRSHKRRGSTTQLARLDGRNLTKSSTRLGHSRRGSSG